jgi:hypothetical protein
MLSVPSGKYADINKAGYFGHVILSEGKDDLL